MISSLHHLYVANTLDRTQFDQNIALSIGLTCLTDDCQLKHTVSVSFPLIKTADSRAGTRLAS